jgi:hypothetical protein
MCSYKLIATPIANPLELLFGQEVLHDHLQCFKYYLVDMQTQYFQIEEDIKFPKVLNVKKFLGETWKLIT